MPYRNLRAFVETLEFNKELIRVSEFVSPNLEITEITDRFSKHCGKAILFENNGTQFPLLINAMGSEKRMCLALGVDSLDDIGKEIMALAGNMMMSRDSFFSKLALLPTLAGIAPPAFFDRNVSSQAIFAWIITLAGRKRPSNRRAGSSHLERA